MRDPLPSYVHERLYDLAESMKDAHESATPEELEECYDELRGYCMALINEGMECALLWEVLGDFTRDDERALKFYECGLAAAEGDEEPVYSILVGMGERHANRELYGEARELLSRGLQLAVAAGDSAMATRADVLLSELPS